MDNVSQALSLELPLGELRYFTDSKVSLYWIQGEDKEWKPFVQNRVNQIRSVTQTSQWAHCAGKENPAGLMLLNSETIRSAIRPLLATNRSR